MPNKLPNRRASWTQKAVVGGTTCYLTMGEHTDGSLGEIFIVVQKAGSALRAMMDTFARSFSASLQHGVPLTALLELHRGLDFEPNGSVIAEGSAVREASSIVDWVVQEVQNAYGNQAEAQASRGHS